MLRTLCGTLCRRRSGIDAPGTVIGIAYDRSLAPSELAQDDAVCCRSRGAGLAIGTRPVSSAWKGGRGVLCECEGGTSWPEAGGETKATTDGAGDATCATAGGCASGTGWTRGAMSRK